MFESIKCNKKRQTFVAVDDDNILIPNCSDLLSLEFVQEDSPANCTFFSI